MSSPSTPQVFVPEDFYCPITGSLMDDPVSCPEGHTYERRAITTWLQSKGTCPLSRVPLSIIELSPNKAMKRSIESIRVKLTDEQLQAESRVQAIQDEDDDITPDTYSLEMTALASGTLVSIRMPEVSAVSTVSAVGSERRAVDIVLCIDVSGSMGAEATLKSSSGEDIGDGFSVLSLTVAAAKTVLATMNGHDHLSIVTYTNVAKTIVAHQVCSPANKRAITLKLDALKPLYTTNIWEGLHQSMEILRTTESKDRLQAIFLLTDGIPNIEPPRGHEGMLERYYTTHGYRCMINCYGFGYNLDSQLLRNISKMSGGDGFSYIPDASLLGNIFIHGLSNFYTTALMDASLKVVFEDDSEDTVQIDSLKYGQDRHLRLTGKEGKVGKVSKEGKVSIKSLTLTHGSRTIAETDRLTEDTISLKDQMFRLRACDILEGALERQVCGDTSYRPALDTFIEEMVAMDGKTRYIQNILEDFKDQVKQGLNMTTEGSTGGWFERWGKHYLRSLLGAYQREICNNFKDKGVSNFGSTMFETIRDEVSEIFDAMPPPKNTVMSGSDSARYGAAVARPDDRYSRSSQMAPITMASYNTAGGSCCASGSLVWVRDMTDGVWKTPVEDLVKGDMVYTVDEQGNHSYMPLECIVRTECPEGTAALVQVSDLLVTPYHPIRIDGVWIFPSSLGQTVVRDCEALYSFVVPNRRPMIVDGQIFSTWGHDIQGPVIGHEYFGSSKVIDDMKLFTTYELGIVNLDPEMIQRDPTNGLICKIAY